MSAIPVERVNPSDLAALAREAGDAALEAELGALERRARDGRFYVALLGQFKRGKSTLVNALLEADVLPTGVTPVTSVITLVRFGPVPRATVMTPDASVHDIPVRALPDYVTEQGNPGNRRGVRVVEIEWPAPLLGSGACLVDTPGVGSVIAASAAETHGFVPQVDVALIVLGVDPPITASELELVRSLSIEGVPMLVVLNKIDHLAPEEIEAGAGFTRQVLNEQLRQEVLVLTVSARAARQGQPLADGRPRGGIDDLRVTLGGLAKSGGAELARRALERGAERVRRTLIATLLLRRNALTAPVQELARLEGALEMQGERIQNFLADFSYRLRGELDRFRKGLDQRRDEFIEATQRGSPALAQEVAFASGAAPAEQRAWDELKHRLSRWEEEVLSWVDTRQRMIAQQFTSEARRLLAEVAATLRELFGASVPVPDFGEPRFAPAARYYFAPDRETLAMDLSGMRERLLGTFLTSGRRRERMQRVLEARIANWARHNATRLASGIWLAAEDARRVYEADLEAIVSRLDAHTRDAIAAAANMRRSGGAHLAAEVARLDRLLSRLGHEPVESDVPT